MVFQNFIFDLDGTLFKGKKLIPGASRTIQKLRSLKKRLFFLTNSATRSRRSLQYKLSKMGVKTKLHELYTSSFLLALYLSRHFKGKKVFCVAEKGLKQELKNVGITLSEKNADIVAVGLDRKVTYKKLSKAFRLIANGAKFFSANLDPTFPVEDGFMPGAGALSAFLTLSSGIKPFSLGKPNKIALELMLSLYPLKKEEIIIIGDRIDTDILFAKNARICSALVLTGVSSKNDIKSIKPDFVFSSVKEVLKLV